jgi:hypothetical protein
MLTEVVANCGELPAPPPRPVDGTVIGAMRAKLQSVAGHEVYALRKAIAEPVFGQIKDRQRVPPLLVPRPAQGSCGVDPDLPHA